MGVIQVPADKYWGAQTQRSLKYFNIGHETMPREVIQVGFLGLYPLPPRGLISGAGALSFLFPSLPLFARTPRIPR
jgi:hypothetical protein